MPRAKNEPPTEDEMLDLTVAIELQTEQLEALKEELPALRDEIRALRKMLDDVLQELGWFLSARDDAPRRSADRPVMHITSMSKDPCADDFRINRFTAKDLPQDNAGGTGTRTDSESQGTFW